MNTATILSAFTISAAVVSSFAVGGPQYAIDWHTVDGGGGISSGGGYTVSGTIGQHDAGGALAGGGYTVIGGFWAGVGAASDACNVADLSEPHGVLDLSDINAFVSAFVTQGPAADIVPDGIYDLADIGAFVGAFVAGCP